VSFSAKRFIGLGSRRYFLRRPRLKGFRIRQLLLIDSYHRSYTVFMFQYARLHLRGSGQSELRTDKATRTLTLYAPSLSSVFLIAAKVIEKSSRSIGKRTARTRNRVHRLTLSAFDEKRLAARSLPLKVGNENGKHENRYLASRTVHFDVEFTLM